MNILSEEQKRERAQRISAAALKLFETRSFGAITMSDIAKAAEVSKGTLFNYFDCKESLFMTLLLDGYQDYFDDLMSEISAQTDFSLHDFAHLLLDSTSKLVRERPSLVRLNALRGPILEHGANMEQTIDHRQKLYDKNQQLATLIADQIPSLPQSEVSRLFIVQSAVISGLMNMNGLDSFDHVTLENRDFSDFQVDLAHDCTEVMRNYLIGKFPSVKL